MRDITEKLDAKLQAKLPLLQPEEKIKVIVQLRERLIPKGTGRKEKIEDLRKSCLEKQKPLVEALEKLGCQEEILQDYLSNSIVTSLTRKQIESVATLEEIDCIRLSEKLKVTC